MLQVIILEKNSLANYLIILIEVHLIALQNTANIRENTTGSVQKSIDSGSIMCYVFNQMVKMQKSGENYAGTCG